MKRQCQQLQSLIAGPGLTVSLAAHDCLTARILAQAGMKMLFVGGFGISASRLGMPDLGLLTLTEMVDAARAICRSVDIPVVVDADTGHGGPDNIRRTVREMEDLGAAGLLLEDQENPKRCGHFSGQKVVSREEMRARLRIAIDARRHDDFAIFARTDARSTHGIDEAITRAREFGDMGASVCFVEAPRSAEELQKIAAEVPHPLLANMLTDGQTPILEASRLEALGFRISVCPVATLMGLTAVTQRLADTLLRDGSLNAISDQMAGFTELKHRLGMTDTDPEPPIRNPDHLGFRIPPSSS